MLAGRRFQAAVFDMDGLLLDSERPIRDGWLRLSAEAGTPLTEADYLLTVGRNRQDSLLILSEKLGSREAALAMYEAVDGTLSDFDLKPGALALLQALEAKGVRCAVASSTRHPEVLRRLGAAGITRYFGPIHGGDQVARGKPHPDLFELAAASLGVAAEHCIVFEDSSLGARGALAAGMGVVIVPDLKQADADVAPHCLVLTSLNDAQPRLNTWFS